MSSEKHSVAVQSLHALVGTSAAPLVLDVRRDEPVQEHPRLIAGALRLDAAMPAQLPPGATLVVYCVHGYDISRNVAATLCAAGHHARFLEGGLEAWEQFGGATLKIAMRKVHAGGSHWVTRERPKVDRIACPWLIRRFIDPLAVFDYVPADSVIEHAQACDAIAYDVPGVQFTHRGEHCSFDALMADFDLRDPALHKLAAVVRGADTDRLDLTPQCAGLLALSLGLSANHRDDHEMLERGMVMYDALYAWCKQQSPERHGWGFPS